MTAKRFDSIYYEDFCRVITDNGEEINPRQVVELLNELHEENRALQRHVDVMRSGALTDDKRIKELYNENKQFVTKCHNLEEENEQLKQQIKELELLNDSLIYALKYIRKIDVEIDVGDV